VLKVIDSLSEYENLYSRYVISKKVSAYTNLFINKRKLCSYIKDKRMKYDVVNDSLFLFVNEYCYYKLYFYGIGINFEKLPVVDKNVCCDVYLHKNNLLRSNCVKKLFINRGFVHEGRYEQVRLCYGKLYNEACKYLKDNSQKLIKHNMYIKNLNYDDKDKFEQIVINNIGMYDGLSIEDELWEEQIKNNNVVGIYILDNLIAVYYFTEKASRIIVEKDYRGKNLSVLLRMYFAAQNRWKNSSKNHYDWVERNNMASKITFEKLCAVYTGKVKDRYVKIF
jgi:hypothetical protein